MSITKKQAGCAVALALLVFASAAHAADRKVMLPIQVALASNSAEARLGDAVKFYFGSQQTPAVVKRLAVDQTSQKTNAFGKSDETACNWVFLSAMRQLEKRARELGANAVVNIVSNYRNVVYSSETEFECHAGALMAGVALKGEFVKVAE
jgi:uncharacterized protein YbjQ (UPF0145 family)